MAHTYSCLLNHVVFSTQERRPWLEQSFRGELHAYLGGIARALEATALGVNGTADHVHLLLSLSPKHAVADVVRELKSRSSAWLHREHGRTHAAFAWQEGYSTFSVSLSGKEKVLAYIAGQKAHHREKGFEEKIIGLLRRHGVTYDERFVFGRNLSTLAGVPRGLP